MQRVSNPQIVSLRGLICKLRRRIWFTDPPFLPYILVGEREQSLLSLSKTSPFLASQICPDFDLCAKCEEASAHDTHPASHPPLLVKLRLPEAAYGHIGHLSGRSHIQPHGVNCGVCAKPIVGIRLDVYKVLSSLVLSCPCQDKPSDKRVSQQIDHSCARLCGPNPCDFSASV
jgi:hypothetical protein